MVKNAPAMQTRLQSLSQEDPLEKEMAAHSSIPAWGIPRIEEPGMLAHRFTKSQPRLSDTTFSKVRQEFSVIHSKFCVSVLCPFIRLADPPTF